MPSKTKENYLKALYSLSIHDPEVTVSDLSKELGVSVPTVNSMVKKLEAGKWVKYEKYKPLTMTAKGRRTAAAIIRKHRLTEMFLVQVMGFGWEEVHDIAEDMEHIDSEMLFDRMDELLDFPLVDPHGSPIPDKQGNVKEHDHRPLSDLGEGARARLRALNDSSKTLLEYLNSHRIRLGSEMTKGHTEAFDGSARVTMGDGRELTLSREVCGSLLVELL